jgi:hypothetical protein
LLGSVNFEPSNVPFRDRNDSLSVILIFASRYDQSSVSLAARWADHNASIISCDDLSVAGWRHDLHSLAASTAVVGGRIISVQEIKGVLVRWPGVFAQELTQITPADRDYVAREMMAFLVSWFSTLKCPVINQPTPVNLSGPAWRLEQWTHAASQIDIPIQKAQRHVAFGADDVDKVEPSLPLTTTNVTVVGDRCFGDVDQKLREGSVRLAKAAGVSLLSVSFSGSEANSFFVGADLLPKLSEETEDAVLDLLLKKKAGAA